ncbi:MAG: hypothetical protein Q9M36_03370 [Sulfurovum sp.]|nr:hypothetical protein [Sulfurovum sp.]
MQDPKSKKAFEEEHDCTVKFVGVSSSIGALRKIQLEGKRTKADILLGLDTSIAQVAKKNQALHSSYTRYPKCGFTHRLS